MVPVFTVNRSISLASSFAPAASPRLRRRPSPWPPHRHAKPASESSVHRGRSRTAPRPLSTRFEPVPRLRSFRTGSSRMPSDPARRTRLAWQCRAVPALSALLPSHPASPGPDCAQLLPGCCDSPARRTRTSFGSQRLTAHAGHVPDLRTVVRLNAQVSLGRTTRCAAERQGRYRLPPPGHWATRRRRGRRCSGEGLPASLGGPWQGVTRRPAG